MYSQRHDIKMLTSLTDSGYAQHACCQAVQPATGTNGQNFCRPSPLAPQQTQQHTIKVLTQPTDARLVQRSTPDVWPSCLRSSPVALLPWCGVATALAVCRDAGVKGSCLVTVPSPPDKAASAAGLRGSHAC